MLDNLMTTREACAAAHVPYMTLDSWMRKGHVPFVRLSAYRLVRLDDVLAYRDGREKARRQHAG